MLARLLRFRSPWAGRFGRRLIREVLLHIALASLVFTTLFLVIDLVEVSNRVVPGAPEGALLMLSVLELPRVVRDLFLVAVPLGAMSAVGGFARRRELTAFFAAGASPLALVKPIALAGGIVCFAYAALLEWVVPTTLAEVRALRSDLGLKESRMIFATDEEWFRGRDGFYRIRSLGDAAGRRLRGVLILKNRRGRIRERWDIDQIVFENGGWTTGRGVERHFGRTLAGRRFEGEALVLSEQPDDFVQRIAAPAYLKYRELTATTRARERLARPAGEHRLELFSRHAAPLTAFGLLLLSAALALRLGRRQSLAVNLAYGSSVGFAAWLLGELSRLFGVSGTMPPWAAAHGTLLVLLPLTVYAWLRVRRFGIGER